jgi:eukaryotic-like serine/threonine-protein kinase
VLLHRAPGEPIVVGGSAWGSDPSIDLSPRICAYYSPEIARGAALGPAAYVYSLGAILYKALAGRCVFPQEQEGSWMGVLAAHLTKTPAPLPASVPKSLAALVLKMLAKKPEDRPVIADVGKALLDV